MPTRTIESNSTTTNTALATCDVAKPDLGATPSHATVGAGRVAFITYAGNVIVSDPSGGDIRHITTDGNLIDGRKESRRYMYPTFSGDAQSIAFVSLNLSEETQVYTQSLHVADVIDKPSIKNLFATSEDNIPYLDWSPDNSTIAFLTINPAAGSLQLVNKASGKLTEIDTGTTIYWNWRGDNAKLAAHLGGSVSFNPDAKLSLGDALKGEARKLSISPGAFQSPHFSPNGKHLLLVQNTQERDLLILADANGAPVCSVASLTNGAFFAWSGDGKHIAWIDTVSPVFEAERVIVLDLATNKRIESQDKIIAFWWSPNGRYLATYSILESKDISTNAPVQLSINILDTQNAKTTHVANFLPTRDFGQQLGFFDQYSRASSPWSPDSTALVYSEVLTDRPAAEIIVAKLNTNASGEIQNISARPIAEGTFATWSPK